MSSVYNKNKGINTNKLVIRLFGKNEAKMSFIKKYERNIDIRKGGNLLFRAHHIMY